MTRGFAWLLVTVILYSISAAGTAAAQPCDGWVPIGDPPDRWQPGFAVDPVGHRVFMFGGNIQFSADSTSFADLWELRDQHWTAPAPVSGPFGRTSPLTVWDPVRSRLVLVGGTNVNQIPAPPLTTDSDRLRTWEFDGSAWIDRGAIGGPQNASPAAGAFDDTRALIWCASGARLWRYDAASWQEVVNPGGGAAWPSFSRPLAAFDAHAGLFTCIELGSSVAPLWRWDGSAWTTVPGPGTTYAIGYDNQLEQLVAVVGSGSQTFFKTWNGSAWVNVFPPLAQPAMTRVGSIYRDSSNHLCVVLAGSTSAPRPANPVVFSATLVGDQWVVRSPTTAPRVRYWAAMAYTPPLNGVALVGGTGESGLPLVDTWVLSGEHWRPILATGLPSPGNSGLPCYFDSSTQRLTALHFTSASSTTIYQLVDGGWTTGVRVGGAQDPARMASWDPDRLQALTIPFFTTSNQFTLTNAAYNGSMTFGTPFPNINYASLVYDAGRQQHLVLGAQSNIGTAYLTDGATWSSFTTTGNYPWENAIFVYDPARHGVVGFGGFRWGNPNLAYGMSVRTHLLPSASSTWTELSARLPIGFKTTGAAWDPVGQRIVVHGGFVFSQRSSGYTLRLAQGSAAIGLHPPQATAAVLGQPILIEAVARGGGVLRYQWLKDNSALSDSDRVKGSDTDSLTIFGAAGDDAGSYRLRVTNLCGEATSDASIVSVTNLQCPADIGRTGGFTGPDGRLDTNDFIAFINLFFAGDANADVGSAGGIDGPDGHFDNNDFIAFINRFFAGCH